MPDDVKKQQQYADAVGITNKQLKTAIKLVKEFGKQNKKNIKDSVKYLSDFSDYADDSVDKIKDMGKEINKLHLDDALSTKEASDLNSKLGDIRKQLVKINRQHPESEAHWKAQKEAVTKLNREIDKTQQELNEAKNAGRSFTDVMESSGPAFLKNWAKFRKEQKAGNTGMQKYGGLIKKSGKNLEKMPGLLKLGGKAAKGLGGALGGVSKIFASWPGAILMGLKALWDVGMAADQFVKDANKSFAYVRGPDIMTSDIKGQFKEFNNQIYKAGENIRVGLDATQIRELMESMVQAGYNITNLNRNLMTYRDSIYVASKASKTLGMILPQVGAIMGKMMTDFRMDLDQVDKSFVQVAFDAKKSGLSTDRFWTTVQNASASLALYGVIVGSASKTVKRFTEDMIGGADDAAAATENMYDVFKSGSLTANAAILKFAKRGGANISGMFKDMAEKFGKKALALKSDIEVLVGKEDKTAEDVEQLKKLRTEFYNAQAKSEHYDKMIGKNAVIQSAEMGALAKDAPEILISAVKAVGQVGDISQLSGKRLLVTMEAMSKQFGVNEKTVRMLVEQARFTSNKIKDLLSSSNQYFSENNKAFQDNKETISKAITKVGISQGDAQIKAAEDLASLLENTLEMDADMAKTWGNIIRADKNSADKVAGLISKGDAESIKELKALVSTSKMAQAMAIHGFKADKKAQEELAKGADDTFKGIVGQTLSYKKMTEIAKDEIEWRASSLGVFQALNTGVANIFKFLIRKTSGYYTEGQKSANKQLKVMFADDEKLSKLINKTDSNGVLLKDAQIEAAKIIGENIGLLNKEIIMRGDVGTAIAAALKSDEDPYVSLNKAIKESSGETQTELLKIRGSLETAGHLEERLSESLGKVAGGAAPTALEPLYKLQKSIEKQRATGGDEEFLKYQEDIIASMKEVGKLSGTKKTEKIAEIQEKIAKLSDKKLEALGRTNENQESIAKKQKETQESMNRHLGTIDKNNTLIAKYTWYKIKKDPEMLKEIAETAKGRITVGENIEDVARSMGLSLGELKESYESQKFGTKDIEEAIIARKERKAGKVKKHGTKFQGLQEPVIVSSPGAAVLHPGEQILPSSYSDFKTIPAMPGPAGGGPTDGGSKEININVTATEKDLGQKIANKVREVMYTNQLTGMG